MKKNSFVVIIAICLAITTSAQTLFTYGNNKVDAKDFLRAYNKNNTQPVTNKAKAIAYLQLLITLPNQTEDDPAIKNKAKALIKEWQ